MLHSKMPVASGYWGILFSHPSGGKLPADSLFTLTLYLKSALQRKINFMLWNET
jgi:hypothetical protein